jgi:hypothetical protein
MCRTPCTFAMGCGRGMMVLPAALVVETYTRHTAMCGMSQTPLYTRCTLAGMLQSGSDGSCYRSLPLGGSLTSLTRDHPAAVTPSLYVTDTVCVGHMYPAIALP